MPRRIALLLCLASFVTPPLLRAVPAPLPRRDREPAVRKRERRMAECRRRLDELGVQWSVEASEGRPSSVQIVVRDPRSGGRLRGHFAVGGDGDLLRTLLDVVREVERFKDKQAR